MSAEYDNKNRWNMIQQLPMNELALITSLLLALPPCYSHYRPVIRITALLSAAETAGNTLVQQQRCFVCSLPLLFVTATSHGTAITVWPFLVAVQTQLSWTSGSIWRGNEAISLAEGQMFMGLLKGSEVDMGAAFAIAAILSNTRITSMSA